MQLTFSRREFKFPGKKFPISDPVTHIEPPISEPSLPGPSAYAMDATPCLHTPRRPPLFPPKTFCCPWTWLFLPISLLDPLLASPLTVTNRSSIDINGHPVECQPLPSSHQPTTVFPLSSQPARSFLHPSRTPIHNQIKVIEIG